jgi:hypothetical protein
MFMEESSANAWQDETLVDKLDMAIQLVQVLHDLCQAKISMNEGLNSEELVRASAVLEMYSRTYLEAREAWLNVVS